jgi:hypothetical protein
MHDLTQQLQPKMRTRLGSIGALLAALLCAGCGTDSYIGARALSVQHQYDHLKCDAIVANIKARQANIKEIRGLIAKAERESAGSLIGATVYQPQLAQTQADLRIYQETAQEKGCQVSP